MELLSTIVDYVNRTLDVDRISDYCPNGLQVQGRTEVRRLVTGVTASLEFLERAIEADADAVLVHHGYFWRGEPAALIGMKYARVKQLITHDISLLAYHLPLDTHLEFGNNAQLARRLDLQNLQQHSVDGVENLFWSGELEKPISAESWIERIDTALGRSPTVAGDMGRPIGRVGCCTGGAQRYISMAADLGLDAFVSGEISEQTTHEARERQVFYAAAGHHATERYGVQALGEHLSQQFALEHRFIDVDNPA
ncbi:MAG: Nif3-like dinuclear metal center hexameric protein [Gammaproteobacteria bacterium]|nr:Nif3-like dinuclear metal center hexameric protein [Gammaproteobacteria bacterium]